MPGLKDRQLNSNSHNSCLVVAIFYRQMKTSEYGRKKLYCARRAVVSQEKKTDDCESFYFMW
jgi:hypothetical protein